MLGEEILNFQFDKLGRWWNNTDEIDIIALDSFGKDIAFYECKYWVNKVGIDALKKLKEKSKLVDWKKENRKEYFILFSINGFTDELTSFAKSEDNLYLFS